MRATRRTPPEQRVWKFIIKGRAHDACWIWIGHRNEKGYGLFEKQQAHRFVYAMLVGPIPEGLQLDHLCLRKECVRPSHLYPVTNAENMARAVANRTRCRNGHDLAEEGFKVIGGKRMCARCDRERFARFYAKHGGKSAYEKNR